MASPHRTTTIEEFIESGRGITLEYFDLSFREVMSNGTWVSVLNVVNDYVPELLEECVTVELNNKQQFLYFHKPKLLCYDIYGNPELYFIVLLLNDMADVKEFTKSKIKMLPKTEMNTLLTNIYNAEMRAIKSYNNKDE